MVRSAAVVSVLQSPTAGSSSTLGSSGPRVVDEEYRRAHGSESWPSPGPSASPDSDTPAPGDGASPPPLEWGPMHGSPAAERPPVATPSRASSPIPRDSELTSHASTDPGPAAPLMPPVEVMLHGLLQPADVAVSSESDTSSSGGGSASSVYSSEPESDATDTDSLPHEAAALPVEEHDRCDGQCRARGPRKKLPGEPRRGTGQWYRFHRECAVHPGSQVSVMQACYFIATLKSQHKVTDVVVDQICSLIHHVLMPKGNLFPPSLHLLRAVAGAPDAASLARDVCDKCWMVFPALGPAGLGGGEAADGGAAAPVQDTGGEADPGVQAGLEEVLQEGSDQALLGGGSPPPEDASDGVPLAQEAPPPQARGPGRVVAPPEERKCRRCGNERYRSSRARNPRPKREAYFFGERETVEDLITRPGMIQQILKDRKDLWDDPESFWGSTAGKALNTACGGLFEPPADPSVIPEEMAVAFTFGATCLAPAGAQATPSYPLCVHRCDAALASGPIGSSVLSFPTTLPPKRLPNPTRSYPLGSGDHDTYHGCGDGCAGGDGAQLFDTKQHGSLVCGLKLLGLHPSQGSKNDAWATTVVVCGPSEPSTLKHILESMLNFFYEHDPGCLMLPGRFDTWRCVCASVDAMCTPTNWCFIACRPTRGNATSDTITRGRSRGESVAGSG